MEKVSFCLCNCHRCRPLHLEPTSPQRGPRKLKRFISFCFTSRKWIVPYRILVGRQPHLRTASHASLRPEWLSVWHPPNRGASLLALFHYRFSASIFRHSRIRCDDLFSFSQVSPILRVSPIVLPILRILLLLSVQVLPSHAPRKKTSEKARAEQVSYDWYEFLSRSSFPKPSKIVVLRDLQVQTQRLKSCLRTQVLFTNHGIIPRAWVAMVA